MRAPESAVVGCLRRLAAFLLLVVAGGGVHAAETSFSGQVLPLLNSNCVMCHMPGAEQAGLSLYPDAWAALVDQPATEAPMPRVKPGDPEGSYLYRKLVDTYLEAGGSGDRMPFQRDRLSPADLEIVRSWIEQGARNN